MVLALLRTLLSTIPHETRALTGLGVEDGSRTTLDIGRALILLVAHGVSSCSFVANARL